MLAVETVQGLYCMTMTLDDLLIQACPPWAKPASISIPGARIYDGTVRRVDKALRFSGLCDTLELRSIAMATNMHVRVLSSLFFGEETIAFLEQASAHRENCGVWKAEILISPFRSPATLLNAISGETHEVRGFYELWPESPLPI